MKSIEDITTTTNGSTFFTTLDANMGYLQIALDEQSQDYTIFSIPFGRFRYLRLPIGVESAPEIYQRAMTKMLRGTEDVEVIMDDILIHDRPMEVGNVRSQEALKRCREKNLKLNQRKTKLCTEEVEYIGHRLTKNGMKIGKEKVRTVVNMPEPKSIAGV